LKLFSNFFGFSANGRQWGANKETRNPAGAGLCGRGVNETSFFSPTMAGPQVH
jgi:hypothetical protein